MLDTLLPLPVRKALYRRRFISNKDRNLFMGTFDSFDAAQAAAPPQLPVGYDDAQAAKTMYSPQIQTYDYPAMFWVGRSLQEGMTSVFDLGGHVGIKYYAFKRLLQYPEALRWRVCDVPGVIRSGEELAIEKGVTSTLSFCTSYSEASGFDVLYASGSLQYLPMRVAQMLASLAAKPRRIILNTTAVHPEKTIYTLNSIGFAVCPYRIQRHDELMHELSHAGYRWRDRWSNDGKAIAVPFVKGGADPYYAGGCFDLMAGAS